MTGKELANVLLQHGTTVAAGQGPIADAIIRIGHMGWIDTADIDRVIMTLRSVAGRPSESLMASR
jgi:aspartate aminotransferase-like enzyme